MKTSDIAKQYGLDRARFEAFLHMIKAPIYPSMFGSADLNGNIALYVDKYQEYVKTGKVPKTEAELNQERIEAEKKAKEEAFEKMLSEIPTISGCCLNGFRIKKYAETILLEESGYINRNSMNETAELKTILTTARKKLIRDLRIKAYNLGCNAVIGLNFDYVTLSSETASVLGDHVLRPYAICITAEGTAVVAEREE